MEMSNRRTRWRALFLTGFLCAGWPPAPADTLVRDDFEERDPNWREAVGGSAAIRLVAGGRSGKCVEVDSRGGLGYYQRTLDSAAVRGRTITVRCWVKLENVRTGPREYSTAKLHISQTVDGVARHHATRFTGTRDWELRELRVQVDPRATAVVLDLGIQNATGRAWFDDLLVSDDRRPQQDLKLVAAATTSRSDAVARDGRGGFLDLGPLDLRGLESGEDVFGGIRFVVPHPGANDGLNCLVLRGANRADMPAATPAGIPVGQKAKALALLCAAYAAEGGGTQPCASMTVEYEDGHKETVPLRLGIEVVPLVEPAGGEAWRTVWTDLPPEQKQRVGLGVFRWENPRPEISLKALRFTTPGEGASFILTAITAIRR